jgi:polar amino acid transport system permease protein
MSWKLFAVLVQAAGTTALISLVSISIGLLIGVGVCAATMHHNPAVGRLGRVYVSFFRGAPLLVQLLLLYNLLPVIGINLPSVVTAIIGLSLCTAAYQAENLRGGFASIPVGLVEAADVAGFSPWQTFIRIKAPIAISLTLPAIVNEAIMILKASSLASVVGMVELTETAKNLAASTFRPLESYAAAGLLYLALNWILATGGRLAERLMRGGRT